MSPLTLVDEALGGAGALGADKDAALGALAACLDLRDPANGRIAQAMRFQGPPSSPAKRRVELIHAATM